MSLQSTGPSTIPNERMQKKQSLQLNGRGTNNISDIDGAKVREEGEREREGGGRTRQERMMQLCSYFDSSDSGDEWQSNNTSNIPNVFLFTSLLRSATSPPRK